MVNSGKIGEIQALGEGKSKVPGYDNVLLPIIDFIKGALTLMGNFFQFPNLVKNVKFLGYICDFRGNFPNWESSTKPNITPRMGLY